MAIRDKLKAKFGRSKNASNSTDSTSPSTEGFYTGRTDIEYYKPHEIPKSKYGRGRVDPAHLDRLDAYSFGDAFTSMRRRTSAALSGTFSPGGTQALSAAPSATVSRRPSYSGASRSRASSMGGSGGSPGDNNGSFSSSSHNSDGSDESDDLTRVGTVKGSGYSTSDLDRQDTVTEESGYKMNTNNIPFTLEELEKAMTRANIRSNDEMTIPAITVS